jgi:LAS superfamily LD-carboxypeptidase LdcB
MQQRRKSSKAGKIIAFLVLVILGVLGYLLYTQMQEIESLQLSNNQSRAELTVKEEELEVANASIRNLEIELEKLKEDLEELADDYRDEKDRNEDFEDQIRELAGTLGDLDKLAKTDKELLQKYSLVYFLNENYVPERLEQINPRYVLDRVGDEYFHARAIDRLEDMLEAADRNGHEIKVVSAYRSFDEQNDIKTTFMQTYGEGANTFSADQGFSEHQLGTTVDLITPEIGYLTQDFANTEAYQWLLDNAYRHGFILSYPEENNFYIFEPWHWRFVGEDLARYLNRSDETFYTMDQREIDEYLLTLFD